MFEQVWALECEASTLSWVWLLDSVVFRNWKLISVRLRQSQNTRNDRTSLKPLRDRDANEVACAAAWQAAVGRELGASQTTQRENWFADGSTSEVAVKNSSCEKERVRLVVSHVKCGGTTSQQLAGSLFAVAIGFVNPVAVIRNYTPQIRWDKKIGRAVAYRRLQLCVQTRQLCFVDHQTAQYKK